MLLRFIRAPPLAAGDKNAMAAAESAPATATNTAVAVTLAVGMGGGKDGVAHSRAAVPHRAAAAGRRRGRVIDRVKDATHAREPCHAAIIIMQLGVKQ
eukprot:COSAG01_NODE_1130_length_11575_cov_6.349773_13_plen_98_part_00